LREKFEGSGVYDAATAREGQLWRGSTWLYNAVFSENPCGNRLESAIATAPVKL
jgi:hypothetical protein